MQCGGNPMAPSNATHGACYENLHGSNAYFLGVIAGHDEISYLCCSHGVCVDCEVPPNFYCAEGKRKENDE